MLDWSPQPPYTAEQLLQVIRILRDPENGCPWDKVQTHASIRKNFLEETCEALEAIDADNAVLLREELGDVLFAAVSAARQLHIDPEDALNSTCKKFTDRFAAMEAAAALRGVRLEDMDRQELAGLWANAKAACKKQ